MGCTRSRVLGRDLRGPLTPTAGRATLPIVGAGLAVGLAVVAGFWLGRGAPPSAGLASAPAAEPEHLSERVEHAAAAGDREPLQKLELHHPDSAPSPETSNRSWKERLKEDLYSPSAFPVVVAEPGVPIDPSAWATIGPLSRTPVSDAVFDAKYPPGTTLGTLRGTAVELEQKVLTTLRDLSPALYASGQYEDVQLPLNEEGEILTSFYLGTGGGSGMPKFTLAPGMETDGPGRRKIIWHRFDEHPVLYDELDEVDYLRRRYTREKSR